MTISKTTIFNMALNELGVSAPISNADAQDDSRAIILNNFYKIARDEVLKAFDWNFAEKYRVLTKTKDACLDPRFNYVYDCPADCLSAREVYLVNGDGKKKKFRLSANEQGKKVILTEHEEVILRYTRKIEKEVYFDAEYAMSLALYLAALTGNTITGSEQKALNALRKYNERVKLGQVTNATEGQEKDEDDSTYLDAR
jgi:hypothetical protein